MPAFLREAAERIGYLGPEPDRWRNRSEYELKEAQEPDHFIDLERLQGFGELPRSRYVYYRRLYELHNSATPGSPAAADEMLPDKIGLQPWAALEVFDRLKVAFREYRSLTAAKQPSAQAEQDAIFYAGWLGHYVADGSNPMHTSIHYNGWVGENPGGYTTARDTHSNFESRFVSANLAKLRIDDLLHDPVRLDHPFQDYVQYLRDSNALIRPFYELEKKGAFRAAGTPEGVEFTRARLAAGAQMLLNMWYTAWVESGEPRPGD
ncbi:MAG: nuclease [Acidobacteria bacterium]|nr:nuclease [Acidobacteriota bacterium]